MVFLSLRTLILKLKLDHIVRKLRGLKGNRGKYSEFEVVETLLPHDSELSVIMELDELDEMGVDWDVDSFGTMFWDLDGEWVEGFFERDYGFTAL